MSEKKVNKLKKRQQQAGVKFALKTGLPFLCPLLDLEKITCKKTKEKLNNTVLCELDADTNIDYRLCETFSDWFWNTAKKQEIAEIADNRIATENPPT
jgi:hypothetical protein